MLIKLYLIRVTFNLIECSLSVFNHRLIQYNFEEKSNSFVLLLCFRTI